LQRSIFLVFSLFYFRSEGRSRNSKKERKKEVFLLGSCSSSPVPTTPQAKSKTKKHPNKPKRQTLQKEKKIKRQKLRKGAVPVGSWGRKRGKVEKWPVGIVGFDESGQWMAQSGRREKE
jgi:hypothetical protein